MVLNAILAGAIAAIAAFRFAGTEAAVTILLAVAIAATFLAAEMGSARRKIARSQRALEPMFPTPAAVIDPPRDREVGR